jgi:hypothetical protein
MDDVDVVLKIAQGLIAVFPGEIGRPVSTLPAKG